MVLFCIFSEIFISPFEVITVYLNTIFGTHEDEKTVLYKTKWLDGTKPNTNPDLVQP